MSYRHFFGIVTTVLKLGEINFIIGAIAGGIVEVARYEGLFLRAANSQCRIGQQIYKPIYFDESGESPYGVVYDYDQQGFLFVLPTGESNPLKENSIARFLKEIRHDAIRRNQ